MHHVTLITGMVEPDMFFLQMFGHTNHLDGFPGTGLDYLVVTAKAELIYLKPPLHRQLTNLLPALNVVAIGPVTDFTGNGVVHPRLVDHPDWFVALEAGLVGLQFDRNIFLIFNIIPPIVAILPHGFRQKDLAAKVPPHRNQNEYDEQPYQMGVVLRFRIILHVDLLHC